MFYLIRPDTKIDFVGKRFIWLGISGIAIMVSLVLFFTKGLNYGIDFDGGVEIHLQVPASWDIGKLRTELEKGGVVGVKVQQIGDATSEVSHEFLVRMQGDEKLIHDSSKQVSGTLEKSLQSGEYEIKRVDVVGPAAGSLLRQKAFLAMFYALLVILIYVAIRFDSRYAPGAVLALFHDSVIVIGVFVATQKQFDLTVLAAVLALIGYSNNDTIIVFDRVRETTHLHPEYSIEKAVNLSINETLGRTIVTSLTTFLVIFTLWLFGGTVIENFAFALMIGIVVGTYSSIFIASAFIITLTHYKKRREGKLQASGHSGKKRINVRPEPGLES